MLIPDSKILYLHPTKTAGTSIEGSFLQYFCAKAGKDLNQEEKEKFFLYKDDWQHYTWDMMLEINPNLNDWTHIVSVRHPYQRVISEFKYQLKTLRQNRGASHILKDINLAVSLGEIWDKAWPFHNEKQTSYLTSKSIILHHESLNRDWENLQKTLGIKLDKLKHLFKSEITEDFELNSSSKKIIYKKFEEDFELLGYEQ